jgi:cellobiose transport system permease protein
MKFWLYRADVKASPYLYIAPFFLLFAALGAFPLIYTAWVSLHDWSLLADEHAFVGLGNYRELFADSFFWNALGNTASIWVLSTVPQLALALLLAHTLNNRLRAQTVWRTGVLLPNITSVVAVTVIFSQLFGRDYGLINWLLGFFGAGEIDWRAGRATSHLALSVMVIWRWTGYNALIYLAAMQAIPADIYEAAKVDGASAWRTFWNVTVPMIRPTVIFTAIVSTIGGLQLFAEPLLFDDRGLAAGTGGSDRQFQTLTMYLYEHGFTLFNSGYASAVAWMLFLIVVVVALINFAITRRLVAGK